MKTLIYKELRENLKVALIGLLILSLVLLQAYQSYVTTLTMMLTRNISGPMNDLQPLLATSLLMETAFFCAIFGAALGWLQTRNEAHRDLWAFLIHRPVTRTEIFLGKAIAGLCLYVFGAGLPLVILVAVVRMPGHVAAPFEWAMVLPLVSIFLTGPAFYLAGLLTGLRQARWYASRSFGLGLALMSDFAVFAFPEFWQSLIWIVVTVTLLATAVWGAYQSGGFYRGQPLTGRLALIVTMTAGCGIALFVSVGLLFNVILNPPTKRSYTYVSYQITRDGTICRETYRDSELVEVVDLAGHPLLDPKTGHPMDFKELQKSFVYGETITTTFKHQKENLSTLQGGGRFFVLINVTDKTLWYLDRHGNLTGYDGRTRKFIGSLDPHAVDGTLASEPFLRSPNSYYYYNPFNDVSQKLVPTAKTIYQVDFKEHSVKPVFTLTNDDEIGGYADGPRGMDDREKEIFITTRETVRLVTDEGKSIVNLPYQPSYAQYPQVQLSFLQPKNIFSNNNFAVWFYPDSDTNRAAGWKMPTHVLWLGPEDAITKSADLPNIPQPQYNSWADQIVTTLLPPVFCANIDKDHPQISNPWNLAGLALAFIVATGGWSLARRYHFSTKACVGWALFIFLLGIAGLLALLCAEDWPGRETCPNCKKLRVVDRESCEHCASPFLPPEKNGTEIFAPLVKR